MPKLALPKTLGLVSGDPGPPATWAGSEIADSVEQGSSFQGKHGGHGPGPALLASLLLLPGHQAAKPRMIKPQPLFELQNSEGFVSFFIFGRALLPHPSFIVNPAGPGAPLEPSSHSLYIVTLWLKTLCPQASP